MSQLSSLITGGVKQVQRGRIFINTGQTEQTATVSPVAVGRSALQMTGFMPTVGDTADKITPTVVLVNSTTVKAERIASSLTAALYVDWELTEYL